MTPAKVGAIPRLKGPVELTCGKCRRSGRYDVGAFLLDPAAMDPDDFVGFAGLVHCAKCGSAGPWRFPRSTQQLIMSLAERDARGERVPVVGGLLGTYDGRKFLYGGQAEDHLREVVRRHPDDPFLWTRLGNLYDQSGDAPQAKQTFERALSLDPHYVEPHHSLAAIAFEEDDPEEAFRRLALILEHARCDRRTEPALLRKLVEDALDEMLERCAETGEGLPFPGEDEDLPAGAPGPIVLRLTSFDLSRPRDRRRLVDMFLGKSPSLPPARGRKRPRGVVPRNRQCPCGSGRKYKKCCLEAS